MWFNLGSLPVWVRAHPATRNGSMSTFVLALIQTNTAQIPYVLWSHTFLFLASHNICKIRVTSNFNKKKSSTISLLLLGPQSSKYKLRPVFTWTRGTCSAKSLCTRFLFCFCWLGKIVGSVGMLVEEGCLRWRWKKGVLSSLGKNIPPPSPTEGAPTCHTNLALPSLWQTFWKSVFVEFSAIRS